MKAIYIALFCTLLLQAGCQSGPSKEEELKNEVIKVHDRIMPRNEEIVNLRRQLSQVQAQLDSLKQARPEADTALISRETDSLASALESADNAMSDWMYAFRTDYSGMEEEEVVQYLQEEKKKIGEIESRYEQSIRDTRKYLDELRGQ